MSQLQATLEPATPQRLATSRGPIEYTSFGHGPAVLALHGALGGHDQSRILALTVGPAGYRYIAVSRPGYLSTPLASGQLPEDEADLMAELLDRLGVPDAGVMAVSGGGPSAIHFALRHPHRCRGLILVSTVSGVLDAGIPLAFRVMKWLVRLPIVARLLQRQVERDPHTAAGRSIADEVLRRQTLEHPHAGPLLQALVRSTVDRMPLRLAGTDRDIRITRQREYPLAQLSVPVLAIHGTADTDVPFAHARRLVETVPRAELLALNGGAHTAIFTHNDQVRPRVERFLAATSEPASRQRSEASTVAR
jgi:pimeloyl-ACP methyl ester carboxylesterase